jgi:predicted O-methyltransferase YrrM
MAYFYEDGDGSVCLATTSYASPDASYTFAIQKTRQALSDVGISTRYMLLEGNCHVDDARNTIVQKFLATDCTDLVFLDADVSWEPENLIDLLWCNELGIIGGVYPFRRQNKQMDLPIRMMEGAKPENGLLEVEGLPTGFMRIPRYVLETLTKDAPTYQHNGDTVPIVFQRTLEHGTRWGGDLNFCNKWRDTGGKVYAVYEMKLGHAAKVIFSGSVATFMRSTNQETLRYVCAKVKDGTETPADIDEALKYVDNEWGAPAEVLHAAIALARKADGPIIEAGSGLTTILMAAATEQTVFCLEHHGVHIAKLKQMSAESGITNIGLCACPIKGDWYDLTDMGLPDRFSVGLVDGPPRHCSNRLRFLDEFVVDTILVDDAEETSLHAVRADVQYSGRMAIIRNTLSGAA